MNDTKILGDSGEHYVLSMLGFAGLPCSKLPDNWKFYDLIAQKGNQLIRISVKTRSESKSFSKSSWFIFDSTGQYEWVAFVLKFASGEIKSWLIPIEIALKYASASNTESKFPNARRLSWGKLEEPNLIKYLSNWHLKIFD
jgi:Holliday junction resolvase-like predicted endonuclease